MANMANVEVNMEIARLYKDATNLIAPEEQEVEAAVLACLESGDFPLVVARRFADAGDVDLAARYLKASENSVFPETDLVRERAPVMRDAIYNRIVYLTREGFEPVEVQELVGVGKPLSIALT
ncbi:hypothetical protein ISS86_02455 [Candidatus Microgenomates bacterium]|nr:hypothetical protein [Candidatus Microgenomates bacterium]